MKSPSDTAEDKAKALRERLIGLGERSHRKSYYPELQNRLEELERFKAFLDHSHDAIFLLEVPDASIIDVNETSCRQLGWGRDEMLGRSMFDFSELDLDAKAHELIGSTDEGPWSRALVETTLHRRDGERFPAELTLNRLVFQEASYVIAVARDITKRKEAEEALKATLAEVQEAKNKIDTILRSVAEGLIVTDTDNTVAMMNNSAQRLLNIPLDEALGQTLDKLLIQKMVLTQASCAWPLGTTGEPAEWEVPTKEGQCPLVIQAHSARVQNREGEVSGEVTILRDITRERELDHMKNSFISRAAHELRTPLTSIMGFAEILLHEDEYGLKDPAQKRDLLQSILKSGGRLSAITEDLMDLCIVQAGHSVVMEKKRCDLGELLSRMVERYQGLSAKHVMEVILPGDLPQLVLDQRRIEQVLENLLSNAIKYSPQGGAIRVVVEKSARECTIAVEDSGVGMDPLQVEQIFDSFYRIDTSDTAVEGMGLGMGIAKVIIEAHGGKIRVKSEAGSGTTVYFSLPWGP